MIGQSTTLHAVEKMRARLRPPSQNPALDADRWLCPLRRSLFVPLVLPSGPAIQRFHRDTFSTTDLPSPRGVIYFKGYSGLSVPCPHCRLAVNPLESSWVCGSCNRAIRTPSGAPGPASLAAETGSS